MKKLIKDIKSIIKNPNFLTQVYIVLVVLCNIVACKLIYIGNSISFNVGTFLYAFTFLISNILSLKFKDVSKTIYAGFILSLMSSVILFSFSYIPTKDMEIQKAYELTLKNNWIFVIGSLTAFLISQLYNKTLFDKLKNKLPKYISSTLSCITGNAIDTTIFALITFGLGFQWLWKSPLQLFLMILSQTIVKILITIIVNLLLIRRKK